MLNAGQGTRKEVGALLLLMIGLAVAGFVLRFWWRYYLVGNCRYVESYLRGKLFKHLQTLPVNFYNNHQTGDLIAYAINDINAIRRVFGFGFVALIEGVLINSVSVYYMVGTIEPILTIIALAPVPIVVAITIILRKTIRNRFKRCRKHLLQYLNVYRKTLWESG